MSVMKLLQLLISVFCAFVLIKASAENEQGIQQNEGENHRNIASADCRNCKFVCPLPFGVFADPDNCKKFYVCMSGVAMKRVCQRKYHFDVLRSTCLPREIAVCLKDNNNKKTTTTSRPTPTKPKDDNEFTCPSIWGVYPHPNDCSKFYTCYFFQARLESCSILLLFDAVRKACRKASEVNCGNRQKPGFSTTAVTKPYTRTTKPPTSTKISTEITETDTAMEITKASTYAPESTANEITEVSTHVPEITTITEVSTHVPEITTITEVSTYVPEVTTPERTSTQRRPTGPPETTCKEDDVDCIIDDTGDVSDWFDCPDAIGAFPHPSSDRLFIFCMNKIPSVKKCGLNRVFSKELLTCVEMK